MVQSGPVTTAEREAELNWNHVKRGIIPIHVPLCVHNFDHNIQSNRIFMIMFHFLHFRFLRDGGLGQEEDADAGVWDWNRVRPEQAWKGVASQTGLGGADQEGEAAAWPHQPGRDREDRFEALHRAKGDHVEGAAGKGLGARALYIDVRQCKGAGDFAEEGGFFLVGLDQGQRNVGRPKFDGDSGEAGAGADVGQGHWG